MTWNPTHLQVGVQRARDLIGKGKNGTNDALVTIWLNEEKFHTSIKEKAIDPEWHEECDIPLPENYLEKSLHLQVSHRAKLGIDEFLGRIEIPLRDFDVYDAPRPIWYSLLCKPGQNKTSPRGEIEVRVAFVVHKVKDPDSISTASSVSKRFKLSKKGIKNAASALGKKIKGGKNERTVDDIPDLTGLDTGALDQDDIAENYSRMAPRKLGDSLSLPPSSPVAKHSPKVPRFSPFVKKKKTDGESPPSSNASSEDLRQKAIDHEGPETSWKTHRRGGSDTKADVVTGKPPKPNRRLLQSKTKAVSNWDVSNTHAEFDVVQKQSATDDISFKPRTRTSTSGSQMSNTTLPEVEESLVEEPPPIQKSKDRTSGAFTRDVKQKPQLIEDDESPDDYLPSPIAVAVKKSDEPSDIFTRMAAQMEKEQREPFALTSSRNSESDWPAHNGDPMDSKVEQKDSKNSKAQNAGGKTLDNMADGAKAKQSLNVFDLLLDSDEPETCVDDSMMDITSPTAIDLDTINPKESSSLSMGSRQPEGSKKETDNTISLNPFDISEVIEDRPAEKISLTNKGSGLTEPLNPFNAGPDNFFTEASNPFDELSSTTVPVNPFTEAGDPFNTVLHSSNTEPSGRKAPNPFLSDEEDDKSSQVNNGTFQRTGSSKFGNSKNKKKEKRSAPQPLNNEKRLHPQVSSGVTAVSVTNSSLQLESDTKSLNTESARESPKLGKVKHKDKKAPAVPVSTVSITTTLVTNVPVTAVTVTNVSSTDTPVTSAPVKIEPITHIPSNKAPLSNMAGADVPIISSSVTKTAVTMTPYFQPPSETTSLPARSPAAVPMPVVSSSRLVQLKVEPATENKNRACSFAADSEPNTSAGLSKIRSLTDIGNREPPAVADRTVVKESAVAHQITAASGMSRERQPAIGAEAPVAVVSEAVRKVDIGIQASDLTQDQLPSEFRNLSRQDLAEMVQKLRTQLRKKEENVKDLEDYIDTLLLRVMSSDPNLLVAQPCSKQANQYKV